MGARMRAMDWSTTPDVSYDPVRVESGVVGGVFCIVTETTERVVGERRMALLKDLAAHNATRGPRATRVCSPPKRWQPSRKT
jgi:hypothetical protein